MTADNGNCAVSATWLTGITFSALSVPLALFGMQPLSLPLGESTIRGRFDDYAIEYLGASAIISLGLGLSRLGKSAAAKESVIGQSSPSAQPPSIRLGHAIVEEHELNPPLITADSLRSSGLDIFLDEDLDAFLDEEESPMVISIHPAHELHSSVVSHDGSTGLQSDEESSPASSENDNAAVKSHPSIAYCSAQPASHQALSSAQSPSLSTEHHSRPDAPPTKSLTVIATEVESIMEQISLLSNGLDSIQSVVSAPSEHAPEKPKPSEAAAVASNIQENGHNSAPMLPAAQSYISFARPKAVANQSGTRDLTAELELLEQVHTIREKVQHLMGRTDAIQADLEQTIGPTQRLVPLHTATTPTYTVSAMEPVRAVNPQGDDNRHADVRATA